MTQGFFHPSVLSQSRQPIPLLPRCGACGLYTDCKTPKMPVSGEGRQGILIVAEAPGRNEDEQGVQLVGESGQWLRRALQSWDVDLDRDCWKTNAIICRPKDNRTPKEVEIAHCRPNIVKAIKTLQPSTIILLGGPAVSSVMGWLWPDEMGGATRWAGWQIPCQALNAWICPTFHPQYAIREERNPAVGAWIRRHLKGATGLSGRPWQTLPEYHKRIEVIYDVAKAAVIIREMIARGGPVAFDYETDRLKPDGGGMIYCCSVCWRGKRTIAFPWHGEAIKAMRELVLSSLPKIASNMKFEERWTRAVLGVGVVHWAWDTLLGGHWLDNRHDITSIKFQAIIHRGQEAWDAHIKRYLKASDEDSGINCISRDVSMPDLLQYCGMDSLMEYLVAVNQGVSLKNPEWIDSNG